MTQAGPMAEDCNSKATEERILPADRHTREINLVNRDPKSLNEDAVRVRHSHEIISVHMSGKRRDADRKGWIGVMMKFGC